MFGGRLCLNSLYFTPSNECVVAFGNRIYLYDETGHAVTILYESKEPIVAFCKTEQNYVCVDQTGTISQFNEAQEILYQAIIKTKLNKAIISQHGVYFTSDNRLLFQGFTKKPKEKLIHECDNTITLLTLSHGHILFAESAALHIINTQKPNEVKTLVHTEKVTAAWVDGENVVIGDERGVITTYLKQLGEGDKQMMREHWHAHDVKALYTTPYMLISGGEEGVAVMWHKTASKKDFLPRFGAEILYITANEEATCIAFQLSDNTVRIVDTNNNNQTISIKQIIDPTGTKTQQRINKPRTSIFKAGFHFNHQTKVLCTNAAPGKLQFIDVSCSAFMDDAQTLLQVVPRNWVSRLDDSYPHPAQLTHVCFNENWTRLLVVSETQYASKLHFYHKNEIFRLICTIDNPHDDRVQSIDSYTCTKTQKQRFVTAGGTSVKIWREYQPLQKIDSYYKSQKFWDCESEFRYKELQPLIVHCYQNQHILTITYPSYVVLVDLTEKQIRHQLKISNVCEAIYVGNDRLAYRTNNLFQLISLTDKKAILNINSTKMVSFKLNADTKSAAILHKYAQASFITIVDVINGKILHSFKLGCQVEKYFWANDNLLVITHNLQLVQILKINQIFKQNKHSIESQDSSKETTYQSVESEIPFPEHYRKQLRKRLANQSKDHAMRQLFTESTALPSFTVSFSLLANQLMM